MTEAREVFLADEAATTRLGAALAGRLSVGEALLLSGELGLGKSTLARGLIRALTRPDEDVPSPSFTLVQFYETDPPVAHFDLYRLTHESEAEEIGLYEALEEGAVLVEWPERLGTDGAAGLGSDRLEIVFETSGAGRVARLTPAGAWAGKLEGLDV